jgi:cell division transport system permease protein
MRLAFREALLAFRRTPLLSALGITTIAFSLFALGLFGLVALNLRDALGQVEERVEVRAFLADSTPAATALAAADELRRLPAVASVSYVSPEGALARARRELGEFNDVWGSAVLPASLEVRLRPGQRDPATVQQIAARARAYPFVDDVRYGAEWVQKLYRLRAVATATGIALGAAFAVAAIIIVGATIRMSVLARSSEIQIMRLVGATDGFVRLPFLLDGATKGILGGLLALVLMRIAYAIVDHWFVHVRFFDAGTAALGVLGGALLGLLGSAASVGRHLRLVGTDRRRWR